MKLSTDRSLEMLFKSIDPDKSGKVSFEEWQMLCAMLCCIGSPLKRFTGGVYRGYIGDM